MYQLQDRRADLPHLQSRLVRNLPFTIYSFRNGKGYSNSYKTRVLKWSTRAWSYAQLLRLAANRIETLFNWESSHVATSRVFNLDKDWGKAERMLNTHSHIAVLGEAAPRILWTSTQNYDSRVMQFLLGWVYSNADCSHSN